MPHREDWRAALAICAAVVGAGFASGREIVGFFSENGPCSWLGVLAACAGIAGAVYVILRLGRSARVASFPGLYGHLMGQSCEDAMHALHALLCLITAAAMLSAGGELAALALPLRNARALGFFLTLLCALLAARAPGALSALGALLIPLVGGYYLLMALGAKQSAPGFTVQGLFQSVPMGLLYAAFNASLAGGAILAAGGRNSSPGKTALLTGGLLLALLGAANWAMLRAGAAVRAMALPSVALSARWGIPGYYASVSTMYLAVVSTLCALFISLKSQLDGLRLPSPAAWLIICLATALVAVCGFQTLVGVMYPLLGWICSFCLAALPVFLPDRGEQEEEEEVSPRPAASRRSTRRARPRRSHTARRVVRPPAPPDRCKPPGRR